MKVWVVWQFVLMQQTIHRLGLGVRVRVRVGVRNWASGLGTGFEVRVRRVEFRVRVRPLAASLPIAFSSYTQK